MVEIRRLTKQELEELLETAPDSETRNLKIIANNYGLSPFDFLDRYAIEHSGIVNSRPLYMACIIRCKSGKNHLYTVVSSNVREQFSLFKISKRVLKNWLNKYKNIWATMEKVNPKNIKWCQRLGFKTTNESDNWITLKLEA